MTPDLDRRHFLRAGTLIGVLGVAGCTQDAGGDVDAEELASSDADAVVDVGPGGQSQFSPEELTIESGDTVAFVWLSDTHNVDVQSRPDDADWQGHEPIENTDFVYEHTFDVEGTYEYVCDPHVSAGMDGRIVVE